MEYDVYWPGMEQSNKDSGGRAEIRQPEPQAPPNAMTIEGEIAAMGLIARAAYGSKSKESRDLSRRRMARTMYWLALGPVVVAAVTAVGVAAVHIFY